MNPRPPGPQPGALTPELHPPYLIPSPPCAWHHILGEKNDANLRKIYGTPGRIRTCDLRIRSPLLYPAELRAPAQTTLTMTTPSRAPLPAERTERNITPDSYAVNNALIMETRFTGERAGRLHPTEHPPAPLDFLLSIFVRESLRRSLVFLKHASILIKERLQGKQKTYSPSNGFLRTLPSPTRAAFIRRIRVLVLGMR